MIEPLLTRKLAETFDNDQIGKALIRTASLLSPN